MSEKIISDAALRFMEHNTINYVNEHRYLETAILTEMNFRYDDVGISNPLSLTYLNANNLVPTGNMNVKVSSGVTVNIGYYDTIMEGGRPTKIWRSPYTLYHFRTAKKIYDSNEASMRVVPEVELLSQRGKNKRRSLEVFVNGLKVPDAVVFIYASTAGTDVFVPITYFNSVTKPNTMMWTIKDYSDGSYGTTYISNVAANQREFNDIEMNVDPTIFTKDMISLFITGKYIPNDEFTWTFSGDKKISLTLTSDKYSSELSTYAEIVVNSKTISKHTNHYLDSQNKLFMYVEKGDKILNETSYFLHMCEVFIDGIRIPKEDLVQRTYRHIECKTSITDFESVEFILSDRELEESAFIDFVDDYMEYERFARDEEERVKSLSVDYEENSIPIPYVNRVFPPANMYNYNDPAIKLMTNEERVKAMISENVHYFKNLLKFYAGTESEFNISIPNNTPNIDNRFIDFQLDVDDTDDRNASNRMIEVYIGERKISSSRYALVSNLKSDVVRVPMNLFPQGKTTSARVIKTNCQNSEAYSVHFNMNALNFTKEVQKEDGTVEYVQNNIHDWIKISDIPGVSGKLGYFKIDDLVVFKNVQTDNPDYYFLEVPNGSIYYGIVQNTSDNYQFKLVNNGTEDELYIKIPWNSEISDNALVYITNSRFHMSKSYKINEGEDGMSYSRLILNNVYEGNIIPLSIKDFTIKVYKNGMLLVPDKDYYVLEPSNYNRITCTVIIFRVGISGDDDVDVTYTGIKSKCYSNYTLIPETNKYGFIYFSKLDIPFDMDYMDLYLNGKKLKSEDVVVYSDKLVRIVGETLPFINVVLYSRISKDMDDMADIINHYNSCSCTFGEFLGRYCRDFIYDDVIPDTATGDTNKLIDIFEGSEEDKSPLIVDHDGKDYTRINPFLNAMATDYAENKNVMSKMFDSNDVKDLESDTYKVLLTEEQRAMEEFIFDANDEETTGNLDFEVDENKFYREGENQMQLYHDMFKDPRYGCTLDSNVNLLERYEEPLLSRFQYAFETEIIDANITYGGLDAILDSNEPIHEASEMSETDEDTN